jgi:hypothetical protein
LRLPREARNQGQYACRNPVIEQMALAIHNDDLSHPLRLEEPLYLMRTSAATVASA